MKSISIGIKICVVGAILFFAVFLINKKIRDNQILLKVIERLTAESRVAEVIVTGVKSDTKTGKNYTIIKFLEYNTKMENLPPKYFTFSGNSIQFQSLVIRFDDFHVKKGHPLKGKSAYLFMKVFMLTDNGAEVFNINDVNGIPSGYEVEGANNSFERKLWQEFWEYALNPKKAGQTGIKSAQLEAPGTKFIPGMIYTVMIEHDGGLRIDAKPLSPIFSGEKLSFR